MSESCSRPAIGARVYADFRSNCVAAIGAAAAAALLLAGILVAVAGPGLSARDSVPAETWVGAELVVVAGAYRRDGAALVVTGTGPRGWVLVTTGPVSVAAHRYPFIAWHLRGLPRGVDVRMIWRRAGESGGHVKPLLQKLDGAVTVDMRKEAAWDGEVVELGLSFQGRLASPVVVEGATLLGPSVNAFFVALAQQWGATDVWSQRSAHSRVFGDPSAAFPLTLAVGLWVLFASALFFLFVRRWTPLPVAAAVFMLIGWVALDARALLESFDQARISGHELAAKGWTERDHGAVEPRLSGFLQQVETKLPDSAARLYVFADDARREAEYERKKARYLLFPRPVFTSGFQPGLLGSLRRGDYVLVFGARPHRVDEALSAQGLKGPHSADVVFKGAMGRLYRVR